MTLLLELYDIVLQLGCIGRPVLYIVDETVE